ncbi:MAG: hypothetical protein ACFE0Q_06605 [Anaerolineae bacterium]
MSYKEKNIVVTLVNFSLILTFYVISILRMIQRETFIAENVFRVFGWVVFFAVIVTIIALILAQFGVTIFEAIRTGDKDPEIEYFEDERDKLIDLKGTQATYTVSSVGSFIAMLTFVFGQPPLVMFTLLIFFGVLAQIVGDITRLMFYREGV